MKKLLLLICLPIFIQGCSEESLAESPTMTKLIFPFENSLCNEGTNITPTESTVLFEWEKGVFTDNYELKLKNLISGNETSHLTSNTEIPIVLNRGMPYEWYIISTSNSVSEIAQSATWKFYNAGDATESYAPFPAEIISPMMAESISTSDNVITLDWIGSDIDNDIIGYDVYFGTSTTPSILLSDLNESILNNVSIVSNTIYYWKIITKDTWGNSSDSGVFQFKIL